MRATEIMTKKTEPQATESFEAGLEKLKAMVEALEQGSLPLEESIKTFQEGIALAHGLFVTLNEAEGRVEELLRTMETIPFSRPQE
jgi:exodeoxyribonuclease VII small subunit